jgi:hypothetical protein
MPESTATKAVSYTTPGGTIVERFDKMIETMEKRREKLFREFHAHRTLNPETAKQKTNAIVDQFGSDAA